MKTGFSLCGNNTQGKPCSCPVLALYEIAVWFKLAGFMGHFGRAIYTVHPYHVPKLLFFVNNFISFGGLQLYNLEAMPITHFIAMTVFVVV